MNERQDSKPPRNRMNRRFRILFSLFLIPWLLGALAFISIPGCTDYGVGGTGELVVPREKLHSFDTMELQPVPASQPATLPTTVPSGEPVELSIEQVRRDALANNLDLRVQLFEPTIASEALKAERAKFEAIFTTDVAYSSSERPTITPGISGTENTNFSLR